MSETSDSTPPACNRACLICPYALWADEEVPRLRARVAELYRAQKSQILAAKSYDAEPKIAALSARIADLEAALREAVAYADVAAVAEGMMPHGKQATRLTVTGIIEGHATISAAFDVKAARALLAEAQPEKAKLQ
jgi:hypothetical protein